jgi:spermidine synthase
MTTAAPSTALRGFLVLIGLTAVTVQIVLMRELIVVFYGNEISLGLMLASWLLWTAIGCSMPDRLARRIWEPQKLMAGLETAVALAFPLSIVAVRGSKGVFQFVPGELLGPVPMLLTSFVTLSIFCTISGWLFAAGSRLYAEQSRTSTAKATGSVYLLEALGSGAGGIAAGVVLVQSLSAIEIASLLALLNLLAAASLAIRSRSRRRATMGALLVAFVFFVFPFAAARLETESLAHLWRGFDLLVVRNSVYGNLAVVQTEASRSLFENGLVLFTAPDEEAAEEAVHYALLEHPSPRSLLLIGGGANGSLAQVLQYASLDRVDYVELDPRILDLARQYFPEQWNPAQADPRVHVHNTDGRLFLKTTDRRFDVILVNLPDPETAQLNRFYTVEFFREAAQKLTPSGILSFQLKASENYISPELAELLRCINGTLRAVFPEVTAIPGNTVHFFAARRAGVLTADPQVLIARLQSRHLHTTYVREYYIPFRMMPDRMVDLKTQIQPQAGTLVNRDFMPIAYYFDVVLWSTRFNRASSRLFRLIAGIKFEKLAGSMGLLLSVLTALAFWLGRRGQRRPAASAGFCVATMGFTLIGLEILLLLAFQAIYGYVYRQLTIVIAGFMAGMALGSWLGLRRVSWSSAASLQQADMRTLAGLEVLAALAGLVMYSLFTLLDHVSSPAGLFVASQFLFPGLAVLCGLLGGYQFPLASRIFFAGSKREGSPGTPYALDLAGACLGAVVLSAYLIPVYGFLKTALLMGMLNLAAALAALPPPETRIFRK